MSPVLKRERDHAYCEYAFILGHLGDDRRRSRACAAAHAGGDEEHLGLLAEYHLVNPVVGLQRGLAPLGGICSRSEGVVPDVYLHRDGASIKCLTVSVADNETATFHLFPEHVVHGIATASAHADDLYH